MRLAMEEIVAVAGREGVRLGERVVERMIWVDSLEIYLCPGMLADVRNVGWPAFLWGWVGLVLVEWSWVGLF